MPRRFPATALAPILLAAALAPLFVIPRAHSSELGRPITRVFTPRIYGADRQNFAGVQDASGVMFFGNTNGVLTFDGATWRIIPTARPEAIRCMALAADGNLYVGGVYQIGYLRPGLDGREFVSLHDKLPLEPANYSLVSRAIAHGDAVYFSTSRHVMIWRHGEFTVLPFENPSGLAIEIHPVGDAIYATVPNQPLRRIRAGRVEVASSDVFFLENDIRFVGAEPDGALLVATRARGLFRWHDGRFAPKPTEVDALLRTQRLFAVRRLSDGSLALILANQAGVVFVSGQGHFLWQIDDASGLPTRVVIDVAADREGGLWLCLGSGLARIDWPSAFTLFDRSQGAPGGALALARHAGALYLGAQEGVFRLVPAAPGTANAQFEVVMKGAVSSLLSDPVGLLVAGTDVGIFQITAAGPVKVFDQVKGIWALRRSLRDPDRVWIGTATGLWSMRRSDGTWRSEGLVEKTVGTRTIVEDADGAVWLASMTQGAFRIGFGAPTASQPRGKPEVTQFDLGTHGLPAKRTTMRVYDWAGRPAFSIGSQGFWRFDAARGEFLPLLPAGAAIHEPKKLSMFFGADQPGHLWFQRDANLPRDLAILRVSLDGPPQTLPQTAVDAAHFARVFLEEPGADGNVLWVAGNDGVLRMETARALRLPAPFHPLIRSPGIRERDRIAAGSATLEFEFAAPVFRSGPATQYQTRLAGFDTAWSPWSEERKRTFTNLSPGDYRFEVRARDMDGQLGTSVSRSFSILPPWWRTWWFLGIASASGVGGVAGVTRWFATRALRRRVELLEAQSAVERERLRLARDLHDEVGSGLGRVILFAGEADRAMGDPMKQRVSLDRVRDAAQELVQHAREIVWAVSPQHDALASVIERLGDYVDETLHAAGIVCRVDAPPADRIPPIALGSEARHSLFLATKEAVHNCVKYSEAKTAELRLEIAGDDFVVTLRDHGRGFAPGERRGSGHGMKNIGARAEALGGHAEITSEPGQGTTVTLRVPLKKPDA